MTPYISGTVTNFVMEPNIDDDDVRYTAFEIVEPTDPDNPGTTPNTEVFYINPDRDFAAACCGAVCVAWGLCTPVDVYLDPDDKANAGGANGHRVCAVKPMQRSPSGH